MFSLGCVQAQRCHTGRCPSGVATQSPWLARGLDPDLKAVRCARYVATLRHELLRLARACGEVHPALVRPSDVEIIGTRYQSSTLAELFDYRAGWGRPSVADVEAIRRIMAPGPA
jgi:hypothetical protein